MHPNRAWVSLKLPCGVFLHLVDALSRRFMAGAQDDVRLPFSVLDPIVGDVFSVLWEPEMIQETGSALKILTGEVLSQLGVTVLQATVMAAFMSALQWPIS